LFFRYRLKVFQNALLLAYTNIFLISSVTLFSSELKPRRDVVLVFHVSIQNPGVDKISWRHHSGYK
jgi:hypothetical protein